MHAPATLHRDRTRQPAARAATLDRRHARALKHGQPATRHGHARRAD
ncbi:hypothetical protein BKA24_001757 [Microbacterium marinum]|uniref:Uncharacterized protein n=1 Tax=Microbacterium marinum TaxID=421115 RepID=A0A7W7BQN7_9MICO|nr:hypothetical protein [Microbacterium marinum]MBB4667048.1 hypothetical protein [Microbacterium marinum]